MNPRTDRLAQAGFVVVCMGHRGGHPSRSKWYHNYGYGNLRDYPMADHKVAIEQLCARYKFMDINRVGIHGHSGGGFMSTAAMLLYPDSLRWRYLVPAIMTITFITGGGERNTME